MLHIFSLRKECVEHVSSEAVASQVADFENEESRTLQTGNMLTSLLSLGRKKLEKDVSFFLSEGPCSQSVRWRRVW
jgi:hypothetical protein